MTAAKPLRMQDRYDALVNDMKARHGLRINKWRSSMTGCAWEVHYRDGTVSRLIEAPYPKGPMSAAIFLHEVGHHAIGLGRYKPRCLEEYRAWVWSLKTMRSLNLNVTPAVERRMYNSLHYALQKALRRGMTKIPAELEPNLVPLPRIRKAATTAPKSTQGSQAKSRPHKRRKRPGFFGLFSNR